MLRKLLRSLTLALPLVVAVTTAGATDLSVISRQYSDDMYEAVSSIAVKPDFPYTARVQGVVDRLGTALGKGRWTVVIFQMARMPRHMDVPAFALPGNRVVISDWEAKNASVDMLGFMLGHEMGHVVLGHQTQVWEAIIQRTGIDPQNWTELGAHADGIEPMEREQEYEADKFGYNLANKAGFNAEEGARELFSNLHGDALHPPPYSRLAALGIVN